MAPSRSNHSPIRSKLPFGFQPKKRLPEISTLLQPRDFNTISDILSDPTKDISQWLLESCSVTGENCLHEILRARPPAKLVKLLLQKLSEYDIEEPELSVDDIGRTPLHFAVGYSCEPDVIKILVSTPAGRMSTRAQDCFGRIPLHLAMIPYGLVDKGNICTIGPTSPIKASDFRPIMRLTVAILVAVWPRTVSVRDDKFMTPLELAKPLDFDPNFAEWVAYVAKVGGAVRTKEEIHKQRQIATHALYQKLKETRKKEEEEKLRMLQRNRSAPPALSRRNVMAKSKKNSVIGNSVWSIGAASVY